MLAVLVNILVTKVNAFGEKKTSDWILGLFSIWLKINCVVIFTCYLNWLKEHCFISLLVFFVFEVQSQNIKLSSFLKLGKQNIIFVFLSYLKLLLWPWSFTEQRVSARKNVEFSPLSSLWRSNQAILRGFWPAGYLPLLTKNFS